METAWSLTSNVEKTQFFKDPFIKIKTPFTKIKASWHCQSLDYLSFKNFHPGFDLDGDLGMHMPCGRDVEEAPALHAD